ncbi:hypothetical protein [Polyangium jinanense]|uniref:Lipoprotein n=1 Tax=Polyangium jinanense TaxID=2829994 RepID=A0A9X3XBX7_9BACT|nr:hypothetical protein [Polyangium jinanense]MDC3960803.1 hypothetical protein [Polyangium jinanense]MDC3961032.1 hypothetical protein [Polyangium jinanense]MDC3987452.1 hypothetical protein [Polyangium jinanense]
MSKKVSAILSGAARIATLGLLAAASTGCIVVKIPPPKKGDAFQPPPSAALSIKRGDTHRFRMNCGAKATFRSDIANAERLVIEFKGENLSPVDQQTTATLRLNWNGAGAALDLPIGIGDKGDRSTGGSLTVTGDPGRHEVTLSMEDAPDCGPVNFRIGFK